MKENIIWINVMIFIILITFKIWVKFTFELQLLGLALLIGASWTVKFFLFKKMKSGKKGNN